jgi:muramoyltetrapeptide carboxypeptidase
MGLDCHLPIFPERGHHNYCGDQQERLNSLLKGLKHHQSVLMAARGGYGCAELLGDLPLDPNLWSRHTVCGFSDITALHAFLSNLGCPSLHGPMAATKLWQECSKWESDRFLDAVHSRPLAPLTIKGETKHREGRLVGGNLSVLASLMGSPWQLQLRPGDILFLEDIGEAPYRLFRCLHQLSHSPNFSDCHILWGHLSQCVKTEQEQSQLISDLMGHHSNSWTKGCPAGHEAPNACLWLGKKATLSGNTLSYP